MYPVSAVCEGWIMKVRPGDVKKMNDVEGEWGMWNGCFWKKVKYDHRTETWLIPNDVFIAIHEEVQ
jgi:hypothetical protein